MAQLKILTEKEPALRKKSRPVTEISPRIKTLLDDMLETMRQADGCGLAAPQVGVLRRIVVIEVTPGEVLELINPEIIAQSGEMTGPRPMRARSCSHDAFAMKSTILTAFFTPIKRKKSSIPTRMETMTRTRKHENPFYGHTGVRSGGT